MIVSAWLQFQTDPPVPSPSDFAYFGFYVCVTAAIVCLVRRDHGSFPRALWLDGALGAAGAATALAAALSPVLSATQGDFATVLVGSTYTAADLLVVALIGGLLAVRGLRGGSMWLWIAGGLALFCAADVAYALQINAGTYQVGSSLYLWWTAGVTCIAFAIWRPHQPRAIETGRSKAILVVPMLATLAAVAVLVISAFGQLPAAVVALATFTLLLAAARTFVSFRHVQRLFDARHQAVTDELTGLGNRRFLFEHGEERLQSGDAADRLALILIDLDNFKEINDTFGHHAGDELLRETARRLAARMVDPDLLVRLGGDEFALLITLGAGEDGSEIAARILDRLMQPLVIDGARVRVDASAGVAERDDASVAIADLLRRADVAMYAAKDAHSRIELYRPQLDEANRTRLETIQDLDAALVHRQFVLHYQPKIDVETGADLRCGGARALGAPDPRSALSRRVPAGRGAERPHERRHPARARVRRDAARELARGRPRHQRRGQPLGLGPARRVARRADRRAARRARGARHALELEITESVIMIDPKRAREVLEALRALGLRIAVDDYGTGYCALAYLRDLPIDELKIDRSFIANVTTDRRSGAIVRSTIELAHALGLKVVAEGIEDELALAAARGLRLRLRAGLPLQPARAGGRVHRVGRARVADAARRCSPP